MGSSEVTARDARGGCDARNLMFCSDAFSGHGHPPYARRRSHRQCRTAGVPDERGGTGPHRSGPTRRAPEISPRATRGSGLSPRGSRPRNRSSRRATTTSPAGTTSSRRLYRPRGRVDHSRRTGRPRPGRAHDGTRDRDPGRTDARRVDAPRAVRRRRRGRASQGPAEPAAAPSDADGYSSVPTARPPQTGRFVGRPPHDEPVHAHRAVSQIMVTCHAK